MRGKYTIPEYRVRYICNSPTGTCRWRDMSYSFEMPLPDKLRAHGATSYGDRTPLSPGPRALKRRAGAVAFGVASPSRKPLSRDSAL